jgi:hypothetical protein
MNQPGVQVDDVPPSRLQYFNVSSILSIIPGSQFLNRLRKGDFNEPSVTLNLSEMQTANMADAAWPAEASILAVAETARGKVEEYQIPSFWGFLTSGYIVGLMIMVRFVVFRYSLPRSPFFLTNELYL